MAMVFLAGEVVVDYAIRLNEMFDSDRLWINAYSNDVPCYIASKRVLREGGYEADRSMVYYARPTRLAPEAEDVICDAVQKLLPHEFYTPELQSSFPAPKSPEDSLASITTKPGLKVELVAAEPLIHDPVAFDWDIQGRLWVVEMGDYPNGSGDSGGRVRVLSDTDRDGRYDEAVTFLDGIPFPSGLCHWRNGIIVTAAPNVIYATDTDGDLRADIQKVLYTGFGEGNQQHRVNGLRWGLDGWLYLGNGDSDGEIRAVSSVTGNRPTAEDSVNVRGRDLRIHPDHGWIDTLSGRTQFGRERDDFGNWFGNNNSNPIWHYVLEDRYLRRNSRATGLQTRVDIAEVPGAAPVFPTSKTLSRFNDFDKANRFTSACSTSIYRDHLLGEEFYGNSFTCEPVHNLVSRLILERDGATFHARRADNERESEFFASSDNWTRPVMVRTGPDGALYVADMYRQVIEHPTWIPAEYQRKLNLRAGDDMGRIYRVVPTGECCSDAATSTTSEPGEDTSPKPIADLRAWFGSPWSKIPAEVLVERLASPNGWWRDTAQRLLLHHSREDFAVNRVIELAMSHEDPAVRSHALWTLSQVGDQPQYNASLMAHSLDDNHPEVRRTAVRLLEDWLANANANFPEQLTKLTEDPSQAVRQQLALTVGSSGHPNAAKVLATLLLSDSQSRHTSEAVMTTLTSQTMKIVAMDLANRPDQDINADLLSSLILRSAADQPDAASELIQKLFRVTSHLKSADTDSIQQLTKLLTDLQTHAHRSEVLRNKVGEALDILEMDVSNIVNDKAADPVRRATGIRFLAAAHFYSWRDYTHPEKFIDPTLPVEIQMANTELMAVEWYDSHNTVAEFIDNWATWSPRVRDAAISSFLSREHTTNCCWMESTRVCCRRETSMRLNDSN